MGAAAARGDLGMDMLDVSGEQVVIVRRAISRPERQCEDNVEQSRDDLVAQERGS